MHKAISWQTENLQVGDRISLYLISCSVLSIRPRCDKNVFATKRLFRPLCPLDGVELSWYSATRNYSTPSDEQPGIWDNESGELKTPTQLSSSDKQREDGESVGNVQRIILCALAFLSRAIKQHYLMRKFIVGSSAKLTLPTTTRHCLFRQNGLKGTTSLGESNTTHPNPKLWKLADAEDNNGKSSRLSHHALSRELRFGTGHLRESHDMSSEPDW